MGSILSAMTIKMSLHLSNQIWLIRDFIRDPAPYYQHSSIRMSRSADDENRDECS